MLCLVREGREEPLEVSDLAPLHSGARWHHHWVAGLLWLQEVSRLAVLGEPFCGVIPLDTLQAYPRAFPDKFSPGRPVVALCLDLVSPSSSCALLHPSQRDVHQSPVLPSHIPQTNLASARPCPTSLRTFPLGDTSKRKRAAFANFMTFPWYAFPKQYSNAVCMLPFTSYLSSNHPACRTSYGQMSMASVTSIERRVSNSSLEHQI